MGQQLSPRLPTPPEEQSIETRALKLDSPPSTLSSPQIMAIPTRTKFDPTTSPFSMPHTPAAVLRPANEHDALKLEVEHIKQSFQAEIEMLKASIAETKHDQRTHENNCAATEANRKIERLENELAEARKALITQSKEHEISRKQASIEHGRQMDSVRSDLATAHKDMDTQRKDFEAKLKAAEEEAQAANDLLAETKTALCKEQLAHLGEQIAHSMERNDHELEKPLFNVGVAIRRRFLEKCLRDRVNGQWVDVNGTANMAIIEAGNEAAHLGNIAADLSLFRLDIVHDTQAYRDLCGELYDVPNPKKVIDLSLIPKSIPKMCNYKGTLRAYSSFTSRSCNITLDEEFRVRFDEVINKWLKLKKSDGTKFAASFIDEDEETAKGILRMQEITDLVMQQRKKRH